ncbi:NADP-dependent alcohol dehydrogenase C 2 [Phytophthora cinnamomi]|uniref:NADP-dependent alcohol dehydrogenase C 2 n=1 Tax=Phytophthora cinnamomi TaxID=4785 RepID=UPI00355AA390|nr:NADP-dependent alcohol dehydrogenase C 2 [Phytophthora cinnamomi]
MRYSPTSEPQMRLEPEEKPSTWATAYFEQRKRHRANRKQGRKIGLQVIGAVLAVTGRIIVAPLLVLLIFTSTNYMNGATFFIESKDSYFAFNERDLVMTGGCTGCHIPCRRAMFLLNTFNHEALKSKPMFQDLYTATSWDYSVLSAEALALGDALDTSGAICTGGVNEWGSPNTVVTTSAEELLQVITVLNLSVAPMMIAELKKGIELKNECTTKWAIIALIHLFQFQTVKNSADYSSIPAADFNVFPEYTECRPVVSNENIIGSKLVLNTNGVDLLAVVPDLLKQFPYGFDSSLPAVSRSMAAHNTYHPAKTVVQALFRAYYAGCRVREVNTTGVYIEDTCTTIKRWETYGLMVQSPDDIPVCSTTNVCVHNYYNSLWEWISEIDKSVEGRIAEYINVFRNRYADTIALSVLPGMVMVQMLLMGVISLYQIMSHKRSVLLTQIWAYRCQNGRMQVLYLVEVTYHLIFSSDLYYLGLATGTLTVESVANLTFSFFVFSYTYINLLKARSGEQQLDRHFRLTWETMQIIITPCVAALLLSVRQTSLSFVVDWNGELLRKTTARGAKYCKLNDSCILMNVNLAVVVLVISTALGLIAFATSYIIQKRSKHWENIQSFASTVSSRTASLYASREASRRRSQSSVILPNKGLNGKIAQSNAEAKRLPELTTFEQNCLGCPFTKLFKDCDDFAYMTFMGKRCTTVEALLLTGYLFYGQHIYQAGSVVLLLMARLIPRKFLRTFNVLLIRWHMDPEDGSLTHALSCTWYHASNENYKLSEATPVS